MHFAHEIINPDEEGLRSPFGAELSGKEMAMAKSLIETTAGEWQPEKYSDQSQEAIKEVIDRKIKHLPPAKKPLQPRVGIEIPDILAVLQQSIAEGRPARSAGHRGGALRGTSRRIYR